MFDQKFIKTCTQFNRNPTFAQTFDSDNTNTKYKIDQEACKFCSILLG